MITHKDEVHPGLHPAIVDIGLFDAAQAKLDGNRRRHQDANQSNPRAPLTGRIFDVDGQPMSPTFTYGKRGHTYRYYVSAPLQQGRPQSDDDSIRRVPGPAFEAMMAAAIRRVLPASSAEPLSLPVRIEVLKNAVHLLMPVEYLASMRDRLEVGETADLDAADPKLLRLVLPMRLRLRGGRCWIVGGTAPSARRDPVLIKALRSAHAMLKTDAAGLPVLDAAPPSPYLRRLIRLALLAPDLQREILAGRQPPGLTLEQIMHAPMPELWSDQAQMFEALGVGGKLVRRTSRPY
jgi:site-specific DNA recombinase